MLVGSITGFKVSTYVVHKVQDIFLKVSRRPQKPHRRIRWIQKGILNLIYKMNLNEFSSNIHADLHSEVSVLDFKSMVCQHLNVSSVLGNE